MPVIADPDQSDPDRSDPDGSAAGPRAAVLTGSRGRAEISTRVLLLAALPAVIVGLLIRAWAMRTSLLALNSDEAITGLQGLEVLGGHLRTVVAGNDYGSTTESYLVAPLLTFWTGAAPLRLMALVLSGVAGVRGFPAGAAVLRAGGRHGAGPDRVDDVRRDGAAVVARVHGLRHRLHRPGGRGRAGVSRDARHAPTRPNRPAGRDRRRLRDLEPPDVRRGGAAGADPAHPLSMAGVASVVAAAGGRRSGRHLSLAAVHGRSRLADTGAGHGADDLLGATGAIS